MNNDITYTIVLAFDADGTDEATAEYCAWLNEQGHEARVGNTTVTTIDGVSTSGEANELGNQLWDDFCNSY